MGCSPLKGKYSAGETRLIAFIPRGKARSITTTALAKSYYGGKLPENGQVIVTGMTRKLIGKFARNKEAMRIHRTKRSGPIPMSIWLE